MAGVVAVAALVACSDSDKRAADDSIARSDRPGVAIDSAFGNGGTAILGASSNDTVHALLGTKTDATLAIGSTLVGDRTALLLMRVRADGSLDPSFGNAGRSVSTVGAGGAEALAGGYAPDGKIVVAGSAVGGDGRDPDVVLARYSADGVLDPTFAQGGVSVHKASAGPDTAFGLAFDRAGRIVVAGQCGRANPRENTRGTACVVRVSANGEADTAFGANGARLLPLRDGVESLRGVAVDVRGRIVAAGYSAYGAANEVTLFRLTDAGVPDDDFGDLGNVAYRGRGFSDAFALSLVDDGILVAGFSGLADGSGKDFLLARFSENGRLDAKFGDGGVTTTAIGPGDDVAFALSVGDRGIVVAGYAFNGTENEVAVARYTRTGTLDGSLTFPQRGAGVARGVVLADAAITLAGELKSGDARSAMMARVLLP